MTFSSTTSKQLAARAGRGDLRALETLLRELSDHIDELSPAELAFLDGVTAGVGLDSKALVLGSDGHIILPYDGNIELPRTARFEIFDDFTAEAIQLTGVGDGNWIAFAGGDANATIAVTVAGVPEGQIAIGSGNAGAADDGATLSLILLAKGSLVSLGMTVFECRVSLDDITGCVLYCGLSDVLAEANEHSPHKVIGTTISDAGLTVTNAAGFVFSAEATDAQWHHTSENAGTIVNGGTAQSTTGAPAADTYDTLRIEIDANGDTRFYRNGVLERTTTTAVATTALLIPFIGLDGEDTTPVDTVVHVDYIYFSGARPSSDA